MADPHVDVPLESGEAFSGPWSETVYFSSPPPSFAPTSSPDDALLNVTYCESLTGFKAHYMLVHGYVSLLVCAFGCVANALNIAVLTRREMASPTNSILTGLAFADLLVMMEYVPYAVHTYLVPGGVRSFDQLFSYSWACFVLFHAHFSMVCHTVSIWLTVTLAVWRYIAVAHPQRNREWCRRETTLLAIGAAYLISPLLCITLFFSFSIQSGVAAVNENGDKVDPNAENGRNVTIYFVELSQHGKTMVDINFWTYSVLLKLLPCVALTALSLRLVCALLDVKRRRETLTSHGSSSVGSHRATEKSRQTDRTTRMLVAVLFLFLATELPQGLLALMSGLRGAEFFRQCYTRLGELLDFLALINSSINFILYCAMSRQFRTTFDAMFRPRIFDRWMPLPQSSALTSNGNTTNHVTQITQV